MIARSDPDVLEDRSTARYVIVLKEVHAPLRMRMNNQPQDPIVWWRTKEEALEFLAHSASSRIDEFEVLELSKIGEEVLAKMLSTAPGTLSYVEYKKK